MLLAVGGPVVLEPGEQSFGRDGALSHGRRCQLHRCGAFDRGRRIDEVIAEVSAARITERGATRADDTFSESAMEDRKREGYF